MNVIIMMAFIFPLRFHSADGQSLENSFRNSSHKILDTLTKGVLSGYAWNWLAKICDDFGHRMVGSEALEKVIDHIVKQAETDGFDDVHTEPVCGIPHFVRGEDRATVLEPRLLDLHILGIPGTKPGKVRAEAVVLTEKSQLSYMNITGKIVVFVPKWTGYDSTVKYRKIGTEVAKREGVGLLVKSITPFSLGSMHTGQGGHDAQLPVASLTLEEAEMLLRWHRRKKKITIEMDIQSRTMPDSVTSRNIIFDIKGYESPNEIVVISAHLDSWDVGQGALDDGGGCAAIYFAMKAIKYLSVVDVRFRPRRTIRAILWTAEEQGMFGAHQYFADHWNNAKLKEEFFFVSETDNGAFKPTNYNSTLNFKGTEAQMSQMSQIAAILNSYEIPLSVYSSNSQGDVQEFADKGVPSVGYTPDKGRNWYFNFHHSDADYMNAITKEDLDYTAGIFAVLAHVVGNMREWR